MKLDDDANFAGSRRPVFASSHKIGIALKELMADIVGAITQLTTSDH
jgi:hypothetical protein